MAACDRARAVLADLLDYPGPGFARRVEEALAQLAAAHPAAAGALGEFLGAVRRLPLGELQELYTGVFDFRPGCSLHAGWHLFGDDGRRGLFLAGLAERYRVRGFSSGRELPDHLAVMLRFASAAGEGTEEIAEIVAEGIVPALVAVARELDRLGNPYRHAVTAALRLLQPAGSDGVGPPREEARP